MDFEWFWNWAFRIALAWSEMFKFFGFFWTHAPKHLKHLETISKERAHSFYRCQGPDFLKGRGLCKLRAQFPIQILIPDCIAYTDY